jgi:hypothetical protein
VRVKGFTRFNFSGATVSEVLVLKKDFIGGVNNGNNGNDHVMDCGFSLDNRSVTGSVDIFHL